jgi:hypothetical protein
MMSWNARLHLVLCLEGISFLKIEHPISSLRILFQATEKKSGQGEAFISKNKHNVSQEEKQRPRLSYSGNGAIDGGPLALQNKARGQ